MREGWTYKKLGEVCEIICGQDYKNVESPDGKYPIYGTGGIMGYANQFRCPAFSIIVGRKGSINNPIYVKRIFGMLILHLELYLQRKVFYQNSSIISAKNMTLPSIMSL